jgi:hypothetical protein
MQLRILLLASLVACKPVEAKLPDSAVQMDSAIDAPPSPVTVTVYDQGNSNSVVPGVPVVFVNPNGTAVAHPVTDSQGKASAIVLPGATVTVVYEPQPNRYQLFTYQAVKPGDNIIVGNNIDHSVVGTFTVHFSAAPNATTYVVYGPCGQTYVSSTAAVPLTITKDCKVDMMEIQVHAFLANGTSAGYVSMSNVPFANGSVTMPTTYTPYISVNAIYQGLVGIGSIETQRFSPADTRYGTQPVSNSVSGSTFSNGVAGPAAATAAIETYYYQTAGSQQQVIESLGGSATTYSSDAATTLLPWFGTVSFDLTGKIVVPLDHTGTTMDAPDFFYAQASFQRMVSTNIYNTVDWVVAGPTPSDVTLPTMPDDLAFLNPKSSDTAGIPQAIMLESSALNGWDDVRPNLFAIVNSPSSLTGTAPKVRISASISPD